MEPVIDVLEELFDLVDEEQAVNGVNHSPGALQMPPPRTIIPRRYILFVNSAACLPLDLLTGLPGINVAGIP